MQVEIFGLFEGRKYALSGGTRTIAKDHRPLGFLTCLAVLLALGTRLAAAECGGDDRWAVKVGADPGVDQVDVNHPVATSLHDFVQQSPGALPSDDLTRLAVERVVRVIDARLVKFKLESGKTGDADFHLVISDDALQFSPGGSQTPPSQHSFVAEIPNPDCVSGRLGDVHTPSRFQTQISDVRAKFLQQFPHVTGGWNDAGGMPVRLTGVTFYDRPHGQTGRSLHTVELHPLLDIEFNPGAQPIVPTPPSVALRNPGFEDGSQGWQATAGVISNSANEPAHAGQFKAWLGGHGKVHTDRLSQQVTIPANVTAASLTFYLHVSTEEQTTSKAFDQLKVQVRQANGQTKTLSTFSNLQASPGFALRTFDLNAYKGQTIRIQLEATEDKASMTSFVADDFAIVTE